MKVSVLSINFKNLLSRAYTTITYHSHIPASQVDNCFTVKERQDVISLTELCSNDVDVIVSLFGAGPLVILTFEGLRFSFCKRKMNQTPSNVSLASTL